MQIWRTTAISCHDVNNCSRHLLPPIVHFEHVRTADMSAVCLTSEDRRIRILQSKCGSVASGGFVETSKMNGGMADEALIDIEVHDLSHMIMASRA